MIKKNFKFPVLFKNCHIAIFFDISILQGAVATTAELPNLGLLLRGHWVTDQLITKDCGTKLFNDWKPKFVTAATDL
jgi:hypothetical protein